MNNNKLFNYGLKAKIKKALGVLIILGSLLFTAVNSSGYYLIGVPIGIYLLYKGAKQEYKYKRRGGYIIYND